MWIIPGKMVFIAHPKMASRAVREAMRSRGAQQCGSHHSICIETIEEQRRRGASIGCVIRNPYDVMVSWYFHMEIRRTPQSPGRKRVAVRDFPTWVEFVLESGNGYIEHGMYPGYQHSNFIMRFENLMMDWKEWCRRTKVTYARLQIVGANNVRDGEHYSTYYDERARDVIRRRFAKEIALGGYEFVSAE